MCQVQCVDSQFYACSQVHTLRKARMYNPWGSIVCAEQSMDCLDPCFAHGTIHGLRAQSTDYCAICGYIDCAGQSTDCPNPYFAHNIYTTCTGGYEYQHKRGCPTQFRYLSMGKPSRMRRPDGLHTKGL